MPDGELYIMESEPEFHLENHSCGVSTVIHLDSNTTASALKIKAKKWKPRFCPHCGKPIGKQTPDRVVPAGSGM